MTKLHHMEKHFSSTSTNRKNYDNVLKHHLCLPTNQLEQDHNGTRIAVVYKILRSALRVKRGMQYHCRQFSVEPFLSEEEWKTTRDFKSVLRETSRLASICQNEEKLNSGHGPVMRKALHDILSRDTTSLIVIDDWNSNKERVHPNRSEVKVESFAVTGKMCRARALLETERRFFNNETKETFVESSTEAEVNLTD